MATSAEIETIKAAIRSKGQIEAVYQGRRRELSPHAFGQKRSYDKLIAVQTGGDSSQGLSADMRDNWRCLFVEQMYQVTDHAGAWQTADNHSQLNTCLGVTQVSVLD